MKFYIKWIKKYIKNININNIIKKLNKYGFETKYEFIPQNFIKTKIIKKKKKNKNIYLLKINKQNKIINLKVKYKKILKNIKYIWINNNINKIKKNIFHLKINKNLKNKKIIIIYQNKQSKKQIKILKINIPYNRIDCNNIYNISREICNIYKKKIKEKKINLKIKNKKKKNIFIKINKKIKKYLINYKYLIIKKKNNKKINIPNYIKNKIENMGFIIKNNIFDIINYILIKYGSLIICLNFDKIKNKKLKLNIEKNKKKNFITLKSKNKYIIKNFKYNKKFIIKNNTKKIILISILLNKNYINKNYINNKNSISLYNNNIDKNIQYKSIKNICFILKNIIKIKITHFNNKNNIKKKNKKIKLKFSEIKKKIGKKIKKKKIKKKIKIIQYKIIIKKKFILILKHKTRHDLNIKEDFIEEIIKFYKIKNIKKKKIKNILKFNKINKYIKNIKNIKTFISNIGYTEIINFHFSNIKKENIYFKKKKYIKIKNPILKKMSILRTSLIPELINIIKYNIKFKNKSIKIFEIGNCYKKKKKKIIIKKKISLLLYGLKYKKNWNTKKKKFNFFDIKNDLELIIKKQNKINKLYIKKSKNKFLDKIQNANIYINKKKIGFIGKINNRIQKLLNIKYPIFITEININNIINKTEKKINKISKFQYYERDITIIINNNISIYKIIKECKNINQIKKINIIDTYNNKILKKKKKKNITLNIIIKNNKKILNEKQINKNIIKCKYLLKKKFNALIDNDIKNFYKNKKK